MENRQLDALVAQARGWTLKKYANGGGEWTHNGKRVADRYALRWSTDIAEAMALVEELGNWHEFDFLMRLDAGYDGWWYVGWFEEGHEGPEDRCTARASTLPEAICLAYLKARGGDDDDAQDVG